VNPAAGAPPAGTRLNIRINASPNTLSIEPGKGEEKVREKNSPFPDA